MVNGSVCKQQGGQRYPAPLYVWSLYQEDYKLGSGGEEKLPKKKNPSNKSRLQLPEENLAIILLRLTFGGSPGPYEWGVFLESICNLANEILQNESWDPEELFAPNSSLVPKKEDTRQGGSFEEGRDLVVDVSIDPKGFVDIYIDDMIGLTVSLDKTNNDT
eukprot:664597-Ditylum_brightwellii.AAC.1